MASNTELFAARILRRLIKYPNDTFRYADFTEAANGLGLFSKNSMQNRPELSADIHGIFADLEKYERAEQIADLERQLADLKAKE